MPFITGEGSPEQTDVNAGVKRPFVVIIFSKRVIDDVVLHPPAAVIITETTSRFWIVPAKAVIVVLADGPDRRIPCE